MRWLKVTSWEDVLWLSSDCFSFNLCCDTRSVASPAVLHRSFGRLASSLVSLVCSVVASLISLACSGEMYVVDDATFGVTSAAAARFFGGSANAMRCRSTMPSDANAHSLATRSSTVCTSCREESSAAGLSCCSRRRSRMSSCSCLYVYGNSWRGMLNDP